MSNDKIDVIILVDTKWVGRKWEIKSVSISYANNMLIPKWIAKKADEKIKKEKAEAIAKTQKEKSEYTNNLKKYIQILVVENYILSAEANASGKLFAKIDNKYIAKDLSSKSNIDISPDYIACQKIENIWTYEADFRYEDIKSKFTIQISKK